MNETIGLIAGLCTTISFLPQVIHTFKTKKAKDISLPMYLTFTFGVAMWFIYGILVQSYPVIIANFVTFLLASTILFLKLKHG